MSLRNLLLVPAVAILGLQVLATQVSAGQRVALVIGNAAYAHVSKLANPVNDAADLGAALDRLGFAVSHIENAGYAELRRGLQQFALAAAASEMAVVFYAGHGIEVDKRNFLIPVDARLRSDADVEFEAVPLDLLSRSVERAKGLRLIILDACRDNPFAAAMQRSGATRSIGRGLARVEPSGETLVAYAAKEGTVASDGEGRNSPYTTALLAHIEQPELEVGLMFRKVRDAVLATTGGRQEPFVYGSLSSQGVYLAARPEPEPAPVSKQAEPAPSSGHGAVSARLEAERLAAEREFWTSIKGSTDPADIQAYLDQYPEGIYQALARNRLRRLEGTPKQEADAAPAKDSRPTSPSSAAAPENEAGLNLVSAKRRQVQVGLAALGFDPGPADGLFGPKTSAAISAWQEAKGYRATGRLTREQAEALMVVDQAAQAPTEAAETPATDVARPDSSPSAPAATEAPKAPEQTKMTRRAGEVFRDCLWCPIMTVVPAGAFSMGSPSSEIGRVSNEGPRHRVTISASFAVGKYEVTQLEFAKFVEATGHHTGGSCWTFENDKWKKHRGRTWRRPGYRQGGREPVVCVSWQDATAYVRWLSRKTGERYRLLTEAEWEYAARAGTTGPFYFGSTISTNQANFNGRHSYGFGRKGAYRERTVAVGSFSANGFGLYDMHGNVWEWVEDCMHASYHSAPSDGRAWLSGGDCGTRVLRGGSWLTIPQYLRSASRRAASHGNRSDSGGFRVARTLGP